MTTTPHQNPAVTAEEAQRIRDQLRDTMIRELNAEIDQDTIRRFNAGERLVRTQDGYDWVYIVDENGKVITDPERLQQLVGHLTA